MASCVWCRWRKYNRRYCRYPVVLKVDETGESIRAAGQGEDWNCLQPFMPCAPAGLRCCTWPSEVLA